MRVSIRFVLRDLIHDSDLEFCVMNKFLNIKNVGTILIFWTDKVSKEQIDIFSDKWSKLLSDYYSIVFTKRSLSVQFAWFDIMDKKRFDIANHRFGYIYKSPSQMLNGIANFEYLVKRLNL